MTEAADLPPFQPPYELGGSCLVLVGVWERDVHVALPGFRPIRVFGRQLAVVIANNYLEPPKDLPIPYREVIVATPVRRGLELASVPTDMVLDSPLPVHLGQLHYGLPKRLDAALVVEDGGPMFSVTAQGLTMEAEAHGRLASAFALPARLLLALAVRAVTSSVDVLGLAYPPAKRARIVLRPHGLGQSYRTRSCTSGGVVIRGLWCQRWDRASTRLGAPRPVDGAATDGVT